MTTTVALTVPPGLTAFPTETIFVGEAEWLVAVAATVEERFQGLRLIDDLGVLDGMIFVWPEEITGMFTMRTVPIPLEIGFFDGDGVLFDIIRMEPCDDSDDCPLYGPAAPFQFAIETEVGGWDDIAPNAVLVREN